MAIMKLALSKMEAEHIAKSDVASRVGGDLMVPEA